MAQKLLDIGRSFDSNILTRRIGNSKVLGRSAVGNRKLLFNRVEDLLALIEIGNLLAVKPGDSNLIFARSKSRIALFGSVKRPILDGDHLVLAQRAGTHIRREHDVTGWHRMPLESHLS